MLAERNLSDESSCYGLSVYVGVCACARNVWHLRCASLVPRHDQLLLLPAATEHAGAQRLTRRSARYSRDAGCQLPGSFLASERVKIMSTPMTDTDRRLWHRYQDIAHVLEAQAYQQQMKGRKKPLKQFIPCNKALVFTKACGNRPIPVTSIVVRAAAITLCDCHHSLSEQDLWDLLIPDSK